MKAIVIAAVLAAAAGTADAQSVYRCGSSYGQQPCPGGQAVQVADPANAAAAARARADTQADWKRAEALEKSRLAAQKNAARAVVMGPKEPASAPQKPVAKAKKDAKPQEFTAVAPGTVKAKPKKKKKKA